MGKDAQASTYLFAFLPFHSKQSWKAQSKEKKGMGESQEMTLIIKYGKETDRISFPLYNDELCMAGKPAN